MNDTRQGERLATAVYVLAAFKLLLHLSFSSRYGFFIDELYYLACADHLDFGYVDHPPMVAWLAFFMRALLGDSLPALRLLPALAGTAVLLLSARVARELGGGAGAQLLAALGVLFAPVLLYMSHIYSMNVFDVLFCTLALLLILRLARAEGPALGLWVRLGALFGLALLNKITVLFLGFGFAVALLATPHRRRLLTPGPWLCGAIAFALFLPHLLWQVAHGWPTLEFMHNAATLKNKPLGFFGFLGSQALEAAPLGFLLLLAGLYRLLRDPATRLVGFIYPVVFLVMASGGGKPYYLAVFYPFLFAAGGAEAERLFAPRRWAVPALAGLMALAGLALLPMTVPVLPVETYIAYQKALLGGPIASSERKAVGPLPQHYADMFGHPELTEEVAKAFRTLSPEEQKNVTIYANSYAQAGAISLFGPQLGLPKAVGGQNSYWLWGPGDRDWQTVIVLGDEPEELAPFFEKVELAGRFSHPYAMPWRNDYPIVICRGPKLAVTEIWPHAKEYQ